MRAPSLAFAGAATAVLMTAGPAGATGAPPEAAASASNLSGVTVTPAAKPNPLVDPTTQFVRERLPESPFSEQYPRFHDAICVKVQGLPEEFDAFIAKRLIEVAAQVRAPVAKAADCTPNVNVIFSAKPQAQLSDIAKRRDILIGYQFLPQFQRMSKFTHPIEARYVTRTVGEHGESQLDTWDPDRYDPMLDKAPPQGRAGSRLGNQMSAEIVHSLIVADANKVAGEKIETVADYVAVLALARWQGLERCNRSVATILNRMADGCDRDGAPEAATPADLALLTGLYSVETRESGPQQRATIASAIRKASAAH
jgi:hypothetical protein